MVTLGQIPSVPPTRRTPERGYPGLLSDAAQPLVCKTGRSGGSEGGDPVRGGVVGAASLLTFLQKQESESPAGANSRRGLGYAGAT